MKSHWAVSLIQPPKSSAAKEQRFISIINLQKSFGEILCNFHDRAQKETN